MSRTANTAGTAVTSPLNIVRLVQAFDFAARAHATHKRKGSKKEAYVTHLAEVAALVAEATGGADVDLVIAALCHDCVEDVGVTYPQLTEAFGEAVAALVAEVTDDKTLPKDQRKQLQVETAPHKSDRAKMIKIADKVSNLRSLAASPPTDWSADRRREYVAWSAKVVAGCLGVSPWLEDQYAAARALAEPLPDVALDQAHAGVGGENQPIVVGGCAVHQLPDRETSAVTTALEVAIFPSQISDVVEQLRQKATDRSWAVLMFYTPLPSAETEDQCINLQYSIQNDTLGLDWILIGERNVADRERVAEFIKAKGHTVTVQEINDVEFLRVEDGDLSALGLGIAIDLYKIGDDYRMGLLVDGFQFKPCNQLPNGVPLQ